MKRLYDRAPNPNGVRRKRVMQHHEAPLKFIGTRVRGAAFILFVRFQSMGTQSRIVSHGGEVRENDAMCENIREPSSSICEGKSQLAIIGALNIGTSKSIRFRSSS